MILLLICFKALAAPHPVTTTSILTDPEKGQSFRGFGFKLALTNSSWRPLQKNSEGLFAEIQNHNAGNRASIFWHRTQYFVISAGHPFLLKSAPGWCRF